MSKIDFFDGYESGLNFRRDIEKYKLLLVILISASVGVLAMPHDTPVATIATKYIFPAVVAGFSFGIAFMAAFTFWKLSKKDPAATGCIAYKIERKEA